MINPKYMSDKDLIAEYQGWLGALSANEIECIRVYDEIDYRLSLSGQRFFKVEQEFNERMAHDLPRPGTKEEIEDERERAQSVAKTLPLPKKLARTECLATLKTDEGKQAIDEALIEGLTFYQDMYRRHS